MLDRQTYRVPNQIEKLKVLDSQTCIFKLSFKTESKKIIIKKIIKWLGTGELVKKITNHYLKNH